MRKMLQYGLLLAILKSERFRGIDVKWRPVEHRPVRVSGVRTMEGSTAPSNFYVELTAHLIDREIAKFRRGEQAAVVSFTNVVKLARNATDALIAAQAVVPTCATAALERVGSPALSSARGDCHLTSQ
jgi:hypothetical protein